APEGSSGPGIPMRTGCTEVPVTFLPKSLPPVRLDKSTRGVLVTDDHGDDTRSFVVRDRAGTERSVQSGVAQTLSVRRRHRIPTARPAQDPAECEAQDDSFVTAEHGAAHLGEVRLVVA